MNKTLANEIARYINFPDNPEWSETYEDVLGRAIELLKKLSPEKLAKLKKNSAAKQDFVDKYDLRPGSDDDHDYVQAQYAYLELKDALVGLTKVPEAQPIRRGVMKLLFDPKGNSAVEDYLDEVLTVGWADVSAAGSLKQAYKNGKVSRQFGEWIKTIRPDEKTWGLIELYYSFIQL